MKIFVVLKDENRNHWTKRIGYFESIPDDAICICKNKEAADAISEFLNKINKINKIKASRLDANKRKYFLVNGPCGLHVHDIVPGEVTPENTIGELKDQEAVKTLQTHLSARIEAPAPKFGYTIYENNGKFRYEAYPSTCGDTENRIGVVLDLPSATTLTNYLNLPDILATHKLLFSKILYALMEVL